MLLYWLPFFLTLSLSGLWIDYVYIPAQHNTAVHSILNSKCSKVLAFMEFNINFVLILLPAKNHKLKFFLSSMFCNNNIHVPYKSSCFCLLLRPLISYHHNSILLLALLKSIFSNYIIQGCNLLRLKF